MPMREKEILDTIRNLSLSQGSYGRLLRDAMWAKQHHPERYRDWMDDMEAMEFEDPVSLVMFLES